MSQKGFSSIIFLFIAISMGAAMVGVILMAKPKSKQAVSREVVSLTPTPSSETNQWKTYDNKQIGVSIQYPADWSMTKSQDGEMMAGIDLQGMQGEVHLAWGTGFGGSCDEEHLANIQIYGEMTQSCRTIDDDGKENWNQIYKELPNTSFGARAIAYTPANANQETILKILSTLRFTNQNQPSKSTRTNPDLKTYTSPLGISFGYLQNQGAQTISVKESGNKICLTSDAQDNSCLKGQYVEVFQKSANDSLDEAIKKQFLTNYSEKDCFVSRDYPYTNLNYPNSYEMAIISFPKNSDSSVPWWKNADKCPAPYTTGGGVAYFLQDKDHPNKLLFFKIGQYGIMSENNLVWNQTVIIN